ncbi:MAG: phosphorylase [Symploca sp. SIO3C6]|uniref:Phosphorylase n=1 Tax=Symploca sp. SIO1C4 TaxID=2607765 RepID=A0A6B3N6I9_9CYAN|nr:phosphorylase [Symploca sp. SIO3C6]NER28729.1 phosphorylase [Symploca sp. SIO1C4]
MATAQLRLEPGTLWAKIKDRTEYALGCGALQSIPTEYEFVEDNGISFLVRILSNLARKDEAKKRQEQKKAASSKEFNPFLPYEEDLFVANISDTHLCLLNKFNVVDNHLLIVTRAFEEQESWLTLQDFESMWACLAEFEGLAFYNAGKIAGASQRHKHLQIVPLPLVPNGLKMPIEPWLTSARFQGSVGKIPDFPFVHAIAKLEPAWVESPLSAAAETLELYYALLHTVGLSGDGVGDSSQAGAYNLLATREWILIVVRSQEEFNSISVNSLGFAGALLVKNEQQMRILKEYGPINILRSVAQSR